MLAVSWLHNRYAARIQPDPKRGSQSGRRGVVMISDDFRVADDLPHSSGRGWLAQAVLAGCWLHNRYGPGCILAA